MFNKELASRIDKMIMEKFPLIYEYKFDGILLIYGGAVRNTIMNLPVKDFDFILLTQNEGQIIDFIRKFKLKYFKNAGDGYKIIYNDFSIDMWSGFDLLDSSVYDADMIFYDIEKRMFISCGALKAFENGVITEINFHDEPLRSDKRRLKKIMNFIKYISDKKVAVKENNLLWIYKICLKTIKKTIRKITKGNFVKCFRFLNGCKKQFNLLIVLKSLLLTINLVFPFLYGKLIIGILSENYKNVIILIILIILFKIITDLFDYIVKKTKFKFDKIMRYSINKEIAKNVLNFEIDDTNNGEQMTFITKLKNDPDKIVETFGRIIELLITFFGNITLLIYVYFLNYKIGIILSAFILIVFLIKMRGISKERLSRGRYFYDLDNCTGTLGEMIYSSNKDMFLDKKRIVEYNRDNLYNKLSNIIQWGALGVIVLFGLFLVYENSLDTSSLIIMCMYNSLLFMFLDKLGILMNAFSDLNIFCYRLFNLIDGNLYINEVFGNKYNDKCNGIIEFDSVKFKYNDKTDYVIDECSFKVKSNEAVALVGNSGTGKTTILNLIARLYNVDGGVLKIDGVDINEYSEEFIRENVSMISQNPYLFDMSIKDNLRLVKDDITDSEIEEVCELVCMDEFVNTLPKKYDTIIGEGGLKLSGGQKQRLALARALIKNTKIILLDDVIYDDKNSYIVMKKIIKRISKRYTIIVATDDDNLIKVCDRVFVIENKKSNELKDYK